MTGYGALVTDFYELTMLQAYLEQGMRGTAVFEFFVRELPAHRNFLMAAGLEQVVEYLKSVGFTDEERAWLASTGRFTPGFVEALADLRFTGDVDAMPEGTIFFPDEPILRIVGPMPEAQFVESRVMNLLHYQTMVASKAARCVGRMVRTPAYCRRGRAGWRGSPVPQRPRLAARSTFPCTGRWRIPTCRRIRTRWRPSNASRARSR